MSTPRVVIAPTRDELAALVADKFMVRASKALARTGALRVVLTGGGLGTEVLRAIAAHPKRDELDWTKVTFFWGDERFVPRGDDDRNDRAAREALLDIVNVPEDHIVSFPASDDVDSVTEAATIARDALRRYGTDDEWPTFDIAFAGMGPDGHVLSVFPGSDASRVNSPDVLAVSDSPKPPLERLTMSLALLNRSARVWIVTAGADKAAGLGLALAGASVVEVPASGLSGGHSTKIFTDAELAGLLPEELLRREQFWSADDERADYIPQALRGD